MKVRTHLHLFITLFSVIIISEVQVKADTTSPTLSPSTNKYSYFGKLIVSRPNTVFADSSEVLREYKLASAHLAVGFLAYEAALGFYLDPANMVEAKYIRQKDYFSGLMDLANISYLHFFENSFYLRGGWSWRHAHPAKIASITEAQHEGEYYDSGLDLGIGNRWQWEKISLGVEWIGVYFPLVNRQTQNGISLQLRAAMLHVGIST